MFLPHTMEGSVDSRSCSHGKTFRTAPSQPRGGKPGHSIVRLESKTLQRASSVSIPATEQSISKRNIERNPSCLSFISLRLGILKINVALNPRHATVEYLIQHTLASVSLPSSGAHISDPRPMSPCSWMPLDLLPMGRRWNTFFVEV